MVSLVIPIILVQAERDLILEMIRVRNVTEIATEMHRPSILCTYIYDLAKNYHRFYETVPVLKNCSIDETKFRIQLTLRFILIVETIFSLLGIESFERI